MKIVCCGVAFFGVMNTIAATGMTRTQREAFELVEVSMEIYVCEIWSTPHQTSDSTPATERMAYLLTLDSSLLTARDHNGNTLLHIAAYKSLPCMVNFLITQGANCSAVNYDGDSPYALLRSCYVGHLEVANVFKKHDKRMVNIFFYAADWDNSILENMLREKPALAKGVTPGKHITPLHIAAKCDQPQNIQLLADANANLNARDFEGKTPLHYAATRYRNRLAIKKLIELNADVNAQDSTGNTPLHLAQCWNNSDALSILLDHGADATISNNKGEKPRDLDYYH